MGDPAAAVDPGGSQQQHPLQSVQLAVTVLGLQSHDAPPPAGLPPPVPVAPAPPPVGPGLSSLPHPATPATTEDAPATTKT